MEFLFFVLSLLLAFAGRCSGQNDTIIDLNETDSGVTSGEACRLCEFPSLGEMTNGDLPVLFKADTVTCNLIDDYISRAEAGNDTDCQARKEASMDDLPIDLESYCGCPSVDTPDMCPELCMNGGSVLNEFNEMTINNVTFTCDEIGYQMKYINDQVVCDEVEAESYQCCLGAPVPPPPTRSPTSSPRPSYNKGSPPAPAPGTSSASALPLFNVVSSLAFLLGSVLLL
jgi:hypothetical protein